MKNKNIKNVVFICGAGGDAGMTYVAELKKFCEQKVTTFMHRICLLSLME